MLFGVEFIKRFNWVLVIFVGVEVVVSGMVKIVILFFELNIGWGFGWEGWDVVGRWGLIVIFIKKIFNGYYVNFVFWVEYY